MSEMHVDSRWSAYLDGELSPAERDELERRLAANPEERRQVDELRRLQREVRSLPRHQLGAGFADRVLAQIAEREPANTPAASAARKQVPAWAWFAAGVAASAACMLLAFSLLQGPRDLPVAVVPNPPQPAVAQAQPEIAIREAADLPAVVALFRDRPAQPGTLTAVRLQVSADWLLQGQLDKTLLQNRLPVLGSSNLHGLVDQVAIAYHELAQQSPAAGGLGRVDEVVYLTAPADKLAESLLALNDRPGAELQLATQPRQITFPERFLAQATRSGDRAEGEGGSAENSRGPVLDRPSQKPLAVRIGYRAIADAWKQMRKTPPFSAEGESVDPEFRTVLLLVQVQ